MRAETGKATAGGTMARPLQHTFPDKYYPKHSEKSSPKSHNPIDRQVKIADRRKQIPKLYRGIYDKAITGRSRKAAMHAFCLECCGYQIKEVFLCTDFGCALYPYRPRSRISQGAPESVPNEPESKNAEEGVPEDELL